MKLGITIFFMVTSAVGIVVGIAVIDKSQLAFPTIIINVFAFLMNSLTLWIKIQRNKELQRGDE